ncbi:cell growth regulator with RING finger domain protein 1-like isoform X2 [Antedon mediterranea]
MMDGASFAEISEIYCIVFISFIISSFCILLVIFKRQGLAPVIRLSRNDSSMDYDMPGTVMVGLGNPYILSITHPESATLKDGVQVKLTSSVACKVTVYWGLHCDVLKHTLCVQKKRLTGTDCLDMLKDKAIAANVPEYLAADETKELHLVSAELQGEQLGPAPRLRYPLVMIVSSIKTQLEAYQAAVIESLIAIIHLPDDSYEVPCHMVSQLLQTNTKQVYDLQRMYIAADSTSRLNQTNIGSENAEQNLGDCTVCQTSAITRVILP